MTPEEPWRPGQRVINEADPSLGLGTIQAMINARTVAVEFGAAQSLRHYNIQTAPLRRHKLALGQEAVGRSGLRFRVRAIGRRGGLYVYRGAPNAAGVAPELSEPDLVDTLALSGAVDRLLAGEIRDYREFGLRQAALALRSKTLSSSTRGLGGARVRLLPHQLYIAHEVARREVPRVLLADEVGLGKTIEAGLIFCAMRSLGRAERVLVLTPESLVHQWMAELYRRFHDMFSVLDEERCSGSDTSDLSCFETTRRAIVNLDWLCQDRRRLAEACRVSWDLVIVDEAHHLAYNQGKPGPSYQAVEALAGCSNGLLLLTATPLRDGAHTEFGLLRLVDPERFHDFAAFCEEQTHLAELARLARSIATYKVESPTQPEPSQAEPDHPRAEPDHLQAEPDQKEWQALCRRLLAMFPDDHALQQQLQGLDPSQDEARLDLLKALVDRHGTGRVLFRNRRERLRGFAERHLRPVALPTPASHTAIWSQLDPQTLDARTLTAVAASLLTVRPTMLAASSPADGESIRGRGNKISAKQLQTAWSDDPRIAWLLDFLRGIAPAKVLVIASQPATVLALQTTLSQRSSLQTGIFHEGLSVVERDRQAAWFANPEGAQVLLCSEIGGEGRNFQFAHHLVLFDLPLDPDVLEQRIGRLDRIGQEHNVEVHVPHLADSPQAALLAWHHEGLEAFHRPVHGAESILDALQADLPEVLRAWLPSSTHHAQRQQLLQSLIDKTRQEAARARREVAENVDYLVDLNSFDAHRGQQLVDELTAQDADPSLERTVGRLLDHYGVADDELEQGRRSIKPGEMMFVDAIPGLPEDGLGATYVRSLALAREDLDLLSVDHPLVEGALSTLLDQHLGIAGACAWNNAPQGGLMLSFLFVLQASGPPRLELERYLPVTPVTVSLDTKGQELGTLARQVQQQPGLLKPLDPQVLRSHQTALRDLAPRLEEAARRRAAKQVASIHERALQMSEQQLGAEQGRLVELARLNPSIPATEIERHAQRCAEVRHALQTASLRLDAVRLTILYPAEGSSPMPT